MPGIGFSDHESYLKAEKAIAALKDFFRDDTTITAALDDITIYGKQQQQRQRSEGDDRPLTQNETAAMWRHYRQIEADQEAAARKAAAENLPRYLIVAEKAVVDVAERTAELPSEKKEEFTLPAFKALAEFKACVGGYPSYMCLIAFLVTLASIIIPLASPLGKKD